MALTKYFWHVKKRSFKIALWITLKNQHKICTIHSFSTRNCCYTAILHESMSSSMSKYLWQLFFNFTRGRGLKSDWYPLFQDWANSLQNSEGDFHLPGGKRKYMLYYFLLFERTWIRRKISSYWWQGACIAWGWGWCCRLSGAWQLGSVYVVSLKPVDTGWDVHVGCVFIARAKS